MSDDVGRATVGEKTSQPGLMHINPDYLIVFDLGMTFTACLMFLGGPINPHRVRYRRVMRKQSTTGQ
jgi:hypothetical protein